MNEAEQIHPQDPIDVRQLARAIRFALVGIVLGSSLFLFRWSLNVERLSRVFEDMLGREERLPFLTILVLRLHLLFVIASILVPVLAVATLFFRKLIDSFYVIGVLGFITVTLFFVFYHGLSEPFIQVLEKMNR